MQCHLVEETERLIVHHDFEQSLCEAPSLNVKLSPSYHVLSVHHLSGTTLDPVSEIEPSQLPHTQVQVVFVFDHCHPLCEILSSPHLEDILSQQLSLDPGIHILQPSLLHRPSICEVLQSALLPLEGSHNRLDCLVTDVEELGYGCGTLDRLSEICIRLKHQLDDRSSHLLWEPPPQGLLSDHL